MVDVRVAGSEGHPVLTDTKLMIRPVNEGSLKDAESSVCNMRVTAELPLEATVVPVIKPAFYLHIFAPNLASI